MFCRNCEKPIFEGDSFCTFCGARATDAADGRTVNRPPIENPGPAPKKSGSKAWIFIVIGVLAAAAVGIGIFFFVRITSYDRPVRALIQGVEKQDGDKLLSAIHPDMLDAMLEEEGISRAEAADQIQSMFGGLGSFGDSDSGADLGTRFSVSGSVPGIFSVGYAGPVFFTIVSVFLTGSSAGFTAGTLPVSLSHACSSSAVHGLTGVPHSAQKDPPSSILHPHFPQNLCIFRSSFKIFLIH